MIIVKSDLCPSVKLIKVVGRWPQSEVKPPHQNLARTAGLWRFESGSISHSLPNTCRSISVETAPITHMAWLARASAYGRVRSATRIEFYLLERQVDSVSRRSEPLRSSPASDSCIAAVGNSRSNHVLHETDHQDSGLPNPSLHSTE